MTRPLAILSLLAACSEGSVEIGPVPEDTGAAEADADTDTDTDTDTDSDTDTDTDTDPDYFEPDWMYLTMYAGLRDGELTSWSTADNDGIPPHLVMHLIGEEYQTTEDPAYYCAIYWLMDTGPVDSFGAWAAASAVYEPYYMSDACYTMDPDVYGSDPSTDIGVEEGPVIVGPMSETTAEVMNELTEDQIPGSSGLWFAADIDYGGLDEIIDLYQEYYPGIQDHYGVAYATADDGLTDYSEQRTVAELEAGEPAVLLMYSWSYSTEWFY